MKTLRKKSGNRNLNGKIIKAILVLTVAATTVMILTLGVSATVSDPTGDSAFKALVDFFAKWIGRIGMLVAFVGGVMFGLAIKNDDADAKQRGIYTFAAGFIVAALSKSLSLFGL